MQPKVSAVMTTYNFGPMAAEAVSSILNQTFRDFEVIVIDDGSRDDTRKHLQPFMDRIQYVYQDNRGIVGARNRGLEMARGKYVALLDGDDLWHPRRLEYQMRYGNEHPEVGIIASEATTDLTQGWPELPENWPPVMRSYGLDDLIVCAICPERIADIAGMLPEGGNVPDGIERLRRPRPLGSIRRAGFPIVRIELPLMFYRNHGRNTSNAALKMEEADDRMLQLLFKEIEPLHGRTILKRKAYSCAACCNGFLYTAAGQNFKALGRMLKSLALWPFPYDSENHHSVSQRFKMLSVILLRILRLRGPHVAQFSKGV